MKTLDIHGPLSTTAIQCKYHEEQERFSLSLIYKPILQMMNHFGNHSSQPIVYKIYCYFPDKIAQPFLRITEADIDTILLSSNKTFAALISEVEGINIKLFVNRFQIDFGMPLDELIAQVHIKLTDHGFDPDEVPALIYPNAIHRWLPSALTMR